MNADPTYKAWFTAQEACVYVGSSMQTLERAVAAGEMRFYQRVFKGPRKFHRYDLDAWVRGETPVGVR